MDQFPYNQYNSYNTSPFGPAPEKIDAFSVASMVCGIISIILCCTGILSIPAGALGILFAILSKRKSKPMPSMSLSGIVLSCIGIAMGIFMLVFSLYTVLTDPELRKAFEDSYEEYYEEFYHYGFEDLDFSPNDNTWFLIN